jgi:hypothetical protein
MSASPGPRLERGTTRGATGAVHGLSAIPDEPKPPTSEVLRLPLPISSLHAALRHETSRVAAAVTAVRDGDETSAEAVGTWAFDLADATRLYLQAHQEAVHSCVRLGILPQAPRAALEANDRALRIFQPACAAAQAAAVRWQDGARIGDAARLSAALTDLARAVDRALWAVESDPLIAAGRGGPGLLRAVIDRPRRVMRGRRGLALVGAVAEHAEDPSRMAPTAPRAWRGLRLRLARREYRRRTTVLRQLDAGEPTA